MKDDNNKNNSSKKYKIKLHEDSNPGPSQGTGSTTIAPPQEKLRCSVQMEEFLSI